MKRVALVAVLAALVAVPAALASPAVRIAAVDPAGYPHLVVNVVTASPAARPPVVREDGRPVAALQAVNLGAEKSVVVAIDRYHEYA